jgi:hypothetical protein
MKLDFDLASVTVTEFGVGRDDGDGQTFVVMPVDADVQAVLREMVQATWDAMQNDGDNPAKYEPSEKHASTEHLYLPLTDSMATSMRELHNATNLTMEAGALDDPADVFSYFARLTDKKGRRLSALRRASQFKGVLKKRLIRLVSDSLRLIEDSVFKLDRDFDLLVDSANVHILRPSGFEFAGKLQQAILDAVVDNVAAIRKDLPFIEFDRIEAYAGKHPRAARYVASLRTEPRTKLIDKARLRRACKTARVAVTESKGVIAVSDGHELGFLEVLDRRRYDPGLVTGEPERFRAGSRTRLTD